MTTTNLSKTISYALRHKPEAFGLTLSSDGWVSVEKFLEGISSKVGHIDLKTLELVVAGDNKGRFTIRNGMIRANQGHTVLISLGLTPIKPPEFLFHGTVEKFIPSIRRQGLLPMQRHAVHLSANRGVAQQVGARRGNAIILKVHSGLMFLEGFEFTMSENGVWLTDRVPANYIRFN